MVFGELVDSVPIFGSQRRSYILIGAAFTAAGMLTLAGAAGGMARVPARPSSSTSLGAMLIVIGTVIQDVVADAMSTEVVARVDAAGNARPEHDIRAELGMVQVLGRLALSAGILAVAGLSGWLAGLPRRADGVPARADHPGDLGRRRVPDPRRDRASGGRSTGASSAAASPSAPSWSRSASAACRSRRR